MERLDENLKAAIRAHETKYKLTGMETDILMCCETISIHPKKGLFGSLKTTRSAVYVTPKWLVWADSNGQNEASVGTAQLRQIDVCDDQTTASDAMTPDQGLNITGCYTDKNKTGMTFIVLDAEADGQTFRHVLKEAISKAIKS
jgi:hypothetical protein